MCSELMRFATLLVSGLLPCGCQSNVRMGPISSENCRVQMEVDRATSKLDVPPDGSRLLLVDGGDCVLSWKADGWWTVTFAGGEPTALGRSPNLAADSDDILAALFAETWPTGFGGVAIPACAAKQISAGGCGAPAATRAARRMLAGTYRLIGVDLHAHHVRMTLELTDAGRKMLRDALEGKAPPTSGPARRSQ